MIFPRPYFIKPDCCPQSRGFYGDFFAASKGSTVLLCALPNVLIQDFFYTEVFNVLFYDPIQNGSLCSFSFLLSHASPSRGSYRENFIYFFYFSACRGHFLPSRDFYRTNFQSHSFANGDSYRKKRPLRLSPAA